ncbi:hypothetical protein [Neomicrococcus lactis]|uniref:hypothetical protein n=1 Tax=Neomicrococcus lactis TaxID=732241 RepID=UPI0023011421|nr:hypothetical protein [Neomicrococcus lactis]
MKIQMRLVGPASIVAALALSLAGCGTSSSTSTPAPPESAHLLEQLDTPAPELGFAAGRIATECLADQGFRLKSNWVHDAPRPIFSADSFFDSEDQARTYGFTSTVKNSFNELEESLSPERQQKFQVAFFGNDSSAVYYALSSGTKVGMSTDGCLGKAVAEVYGSVVNYLMVSNAVNDILVASTDFRAERSQILAKASGEFVACMNAKGHPVTDQNTISLAAEKFGVYRAEGEKPSAEESQLAVADFQCKDSLKVNEKLKTAFLDKSGGWLTNNNAKLQSIVALKKEAITNARKVMTGG